MRHAVAVLALLVSIPAYAGGVGVFVTGGAHTEQMWYHSNVALDASGNPVQLRDWRDYPKYELVETLPHGGAGLEFLLGDRDDRLVGTFRFAYVADAPQVDPGKVSTEVAQEYVVADWRDELRHVGVGVVGLNLGLIGSPDNFQAGLTGHVGAGFLTTDHTEFLTFDLGPMASYRINRQLSAFGELTYAGRFRKGWSNGAQLAAGVRYMFD